MGRTYNVIDADGHVLEPADLWQKNIEPKFRDQAPRFVIDDEGLERVLVNGQAIGPRHGMGTAGGVGVPYEVLRKRKYADGKAGGFDPHERIKDLDVDGIDGVVLYPTLGLLQGAIPEPDLAAAVARTYNRWIADFCKPYPDRLFAAAVLPIQSIDLAIEELKYARKVLGMRSGFIRPNPYNDRLLSDPVYYPLWEAATEYDFAIGIHEAAGGMKAVGVDRVVGFPARHIVSHTMEMQLASLNLIWGGVCERFPKVRFAFLECGGGWMLGWLDRMDRHFDRGYQFGDLERTNLKMRPSEYFQRQCWISFEPPEQTVAHAAEVLGPSKLLWATDYPHSDGFFPGAPKTIADKLPSSIRRQVMAQGAIDFYKI